MYRWFAGVAVAASFLGAAAAAPHLHAAPAAQAAQPPRGIVNTFTQVCANCHGPNGSGGSAPSLLDDTWAHGGSDAEIAASIKNGWPGTPMPAFGATLNEQDIRATAVSSQLPAFGMIERAGSGHWGYVEVLEHDAGRAKELIRDFFAGRPESGETAG